jgi:tetratricopeptide (TPR) repeat protein
LDPAVRRDLRSLAKDAADRVASHLVVAGRLVDEDPKTALAHARAARAMGGRIGSVREAVGIVAYLAGEYSEALAELRTARRLTGSAEHLPLMADSERGLGRPERALRLLEDPDVPSLDRAARMELLIVAAGARRDLGAPAAAVAMLEVPELRGSRNRPVQAFDNVEPWVPRLWYAYADALEAADRPVEALDWFTATAAIDDGDTDAAERADGLQSANGANRA